MASFRKRGSKWYGRITYLDPFTKQKKEKNVKAETKAECIKLATELENKINKGLDVTSTNLTLEEYLEKWLKEYKHGNVAKNTYILHEQNIKNHILPYFKKVNLKDIKHMHYQKFINHLAKQDYSKRTIEIVHQTMYNAMQTAIKPLRFIEFNPAEDVVIPVKAKVKPRSVGDEGIIEYLNPNYINHFLTIARKDNYLYYFFFKTLLLTGMRKGEAGALQWSDIDFENGYINIYKTLDYQAKDGEPLFTNTKTKASVRKIKIGKDLIRELKLHYEKIKENKMIHDDIYKHELDLVFCREDGNFIPKSTLFNALRRILKKANLENIAIHGLRHTHAVLLLESRKYTMKEIQMRLGHSSMEVTSDIYAHVTEKMESVSSDEFDEYVGEYIS